MACFKHAPALALVLLLALHASVSSSDAANEALAAPAPLASSGVALEVLVNCSALNLLETPVPMDGCYDARQEALQQHLFGANFTKVAPFAAPAAVSVATALYAHNAAHNPKDAQESRINLKTVYGSDFATIVSNVTGSSSDGWSREKTHASRIQEESRTNKNAQSIPNGLGTPGSQPSGSSGATQGSAGMTWFGGATLDADPHVIYYIWYGDKWDMSNGYNTTPRILTDVAQSIGGSDWFKITSTYYNPTTGAPINSNVAFGGKAVISSSQSTCWMGADGTASDAGSDGGTFVNKIVSCVLDKGMLQYDPNAIYFVLTSSEVNINGFCTVFCGWHNTNANSNPTEYATRPFRYAFIGSSAHCDRKAACATMQQWGDGTATPNWNAEADGMASIISHELTEAVTDPELNAWGDVAGNENADKCANTYGSQLFAAGGGLANVHWACNAPGCSSRNYNIQRNWVNIAPGYCSTSTAVPPASDFVKVSYGTDSKQAPGALKIVSAGGTQPVPYGPSEHDREKGLAPGPSGAPMSEAAVRRAPLPLGRPGARPMETGSQAFTADAPRGSPSATQGRKYV